MKQVALLISLALASAASAQGYTEPKYPKINQKATIEVWSWVPQLEKTVATFEKLNPNVDVKVVNLGGGPQTYQKLLTALRGGSGAPCVAQIEYGFLPSFIDTGGLMDLTKIGASDLKQYFVPWTWGQVSPDGKAVYAIPQDTGPFAMVYRKDIFDKYNLNVPTTWDEYAKTAAELDKKSGGKVKMGNFYPGFAPWFMALAWADGGQFFQRQGDGWVQTLDNPSARKVLSYWNDLIKKGHVSTINAFTADYWNAAGKGEVATQMEAAWGPGGYANSLKDKSGGQWRVAPLPQWNKGGKISSGNWGGSSNVITSQCKNPEAAMAFISWLNTSQAAVGANYNNGGLFPAAKAGLQLPALHDPKRDPNKFFGGQDIAKVYAQASEGVNVNFAWAPWFTFANDNYNKHIDQMLKGQVTPDQALANWQKESLSQARKEGYTVK